MMNDEHGLNRRAFLKEIAASSGALMLAGGAGELMAQTTPNWKNQIGLELFTVRDLLRQDYEATLAKLAKIGYKEVEPADPYNNMEPKAYKALLDKHGLKMFSTHAGASDGPDLERQLDIGWAYIGRQDAIAMFKKNLGRYELWHVKDVKYKDLDPKLTPSQRQRGAQIVAMGEGDIDYKAVFANATVAGLKYFVIEQDTAGQGGRDAIEDCRIAYENLSKILS